MTEGASNEPVRKQRMGATPQPETSAETLETRAQTPAAPAQTPAAPAGTSAEPPRRTRMADAATAAEAAPAAESAPQRTRMGQSPEATGTAGVAPARTRMGGAAVPAASATSGSASGVGASSVAPTRSRMGQEPAGPAASASAPAPVPTVPPAQAQAAGTASAATPTRPSSGAGQVAGPWKRRILWLVGLLLAAAAAVLFARWLCELPAVAAFIQQFPGTPTMSAETPEGVPAWLGWQHFFNMFFLLLIVRTGMLVRNEKKVPGYFTAKKNSFFSPKGSTPKKVSLSQWIHQALDVLWILNGLIFIVLLFATDQWLRIVPTHWDVLPNALSAGLQYASLDWPQENGWVHYNALQMLAYTVTVFVAAPLAILSGIRLSTWWPDTNATLLKVYLVGVARAIHFPVMLYFVAFTTVHVLLVFLTGALRNLNHMYTSRDAADWIGLLVFLGSVLVIAAAWIFTKPLFMRPFAQRFGTLTK